MLKVEATYDITTTFTTDQIYTLMYNFDDYVYEKVSKQLSEYLITARSLFKSENYGDLEIVISSDADSFTSEGKFMIKVEVIFLDTEYTDNIPFADNFIRDCKSDKAFKNFLYSKVEDYIKNLNKSCIEYPIEQSMYYNGLLYVMFIQNNYVYKTNHLKFEETFYIEDIVDEFNLFF